MRSLDGFAIVENDLVDRYAREGATDETLNRFEQRVGDSPTSGTSCSLRARCNKSPSLPGPMLPSAPVLPNRRRRWLEVFAAAAVLLLVATGYLGLRTVSLREDIARLQAERSAAARQNEQLQRDLESARQRRSD